MAVVNSEEFELSGTVNVENVINTLPQVVPGTTSFSNNPGNGAATLNLRGLGSNRTLVLVNGKRARTPSIALGEGDTVGIKSIEKSRHLADKNLEYSTSRNVPDWLELDAGAYKGTVKCLPTREDIEPIANEQTIVEFYSR